jgi:hypothetical protein
MKNQLEEAKRLYQLEQENNLFAMQEERERQAFDKAFNHGKPALPITFKVKGKKPVVSVGIAVGRRHGNNAEYQKHFSLNMGMNVETFVDMFNNHKVNSDMAEKAVNATITWLRGRSTLGTDTFRQNKVFADYLENILSGKEKIASKFATREALKPLGSAYQIFDGNLKIRKWYLTQTPLFVGFLNCLNLI